MPFFIAVSPLGQSQSTRYLGISGRAHPIIKKHNAASEVKNSHNQTRDLTIPDVHNSQYAIHASRASSMRTLFVCGVALASTLYRTNTSRECTYISLS